MMCVLIMLSIDNHSSDRIKALVERRSNQEKCVVCADLAIWSGDTSPATHMQS